MSNSIEYLKNPICQFIPLFPLDYNIKQNIISVCLFKLTRSYKDFSLYVNGLSVLNRYVKKYLTEFRIRLFIDHHIHEDKIIMDGISKLDKVDLVKFVCDSKFMVGDYLDGLFGTLIRFFPMFDFPNNDANVVSIMDADLNPRDVDAYRRIYENFRTYLVNTPSTSGTQSSYLYFYGRLFHPALKTMGRVDVTTPYALASKIYSIKKLGHNIILDFIQTVTQSTNIIYSDYEHPKMLSTPTKFIFGVDEYFLNNTLIDHLITNGMCFARRYYYQLVSPLYYLNDKGITKSGLGPQFMEIVNEVSPKGIEYIIKNAYLDPAESHSEEKQSALYYDLNYKLYNCYAKLRIQSKYDIIPKAFSDLIFKHHLGFSFIDCIQSTNCPSTLPIITNKVKLSKGHILEIIKLFDVKE